MSDLIYIHLFRERADLKGGTPLEEREHKQRTLCIGPVGLTIVYGKLQLHAPAEEEAGTFIEICQEEDMHKFGCRLFSDIEVSLTPIKDADCELLTWKQAEGLRMDGNKAVYEFESEIVRNYSMTPIADQLGSAKCTMTLTKNEAGNGGEIEWEIEYANGVDEDFESIGVSWDVERVMFDYDGVMSIPKEALTLLRYAGIIVPRDME